MILKHRLIMKGAMVLYAVYLVYITESADSSRVAIDLIRVQSSDGHECSAQEDNFLLGCQYSIRGCVMPSEALEKTCPFGDQVPDNGEDDNVTASFLLDIPAVDQIVVLNFVPFAKEDGNCSDLSGNNTYFLMIEPEMIALNGSLSAPESHSLYNCAGKNLSVVYRVYQTESLDDPPEPDDHPVDISQLDDSEEKELQVAQRKMALQTWYNKSKDGAEHLPLRDVAEAGENNQLEQKSLKAALKKLSSGEGSDASQGRSPPASRHPPSTTPAPNQGVVQEQNVVQAVFPVPKSSTGTPTGKSETADTTDMEQPRGNSTLTLPPIVEKSHTTIPHHSRIPMPPSIRPPNVGSG